MIRVLEGIAGCERWRSRAEGAESVPQGLKPSYAAVLNGTAKPVPFVKGFSAACEAAKGGIPPEPAICSIPGPVTWRGKRCSVAV
jgi:hypothetical protein